MLRECIRHEALAKIILYSRTFFNFFNYVELATFDVASDAFGTFKELLTKHKALGAEFLEKNYDKVFELYTQLLKSQNYVTRRQSLKVAFAFFPFLHIFSPFLFILPFAVPHLLIHLYHPFLTLLPLLPPAFG
jgi:hypothetical protein